MATCNSVQEYGVRVVLNITMRCGMRVFAAKHIDTRVYKVRELSSGDNPEVKLWKIDGSDQPSDIFTKTLTTKNVV